MSTEMFVGGLILLGLAGIVAEVLACVFYPHTRCEKCSGSGKFTQPGDARYWRLCRRCKGTGTRIRTGRRIWVALRGR